MTDIRPRADTPTSKQGRQTGGGGSVEIKTTDSPQTPRPDTEDEQATDEKKTWEEEDDKDDLVLPNKEDRLRRRRHRGGGYRKKSYKPTKGDWVNEDIIEGAFVASVHKNRPVFSVSAKKKKEELKNKVVASDYYSVSASLGLN